MVPSSTYRGQEWRDWRTVTDALSCISPYIDQMHTFQ